MSMAGKRYYGADVPRSTGPHPDPMEQRMDIVDQLRRDAPSLGFEEHDPTYDCRQTAASEIEKLRASVVRLLICGNHIATYRTDKWPDYKLDGLTRDQQCESALRTLGAGREYDMWCCWSGMMQERDAASAH